MKRRRVLVGAVIAGTVAALAAAAPPLPPQAEPEWDIRVPRGAVREIDFVTDQGTWMSVDLSPDGAWIVFDLLGHIYRVSSKGGDAQVLTGDSGIAINFHPRYSPDGRQIAFISDRGGQNNLWVMSADGTAPRPIAQDDAACVVEPVWLPDASAIVVRRQRVCHRGNWSSAGLWAYPVAGGAPREVVKESEQAAGWPSVSPDGSSLYYHYAVCPGYHTGRNDLLRGCMQVRRVDLRTLETEDVTHGEAFTSQWSRDSNGSAITPSISPDGRWLAFARRIPDGTVTFKGHRFGPRNALWARNLQSGEERVLMDPIEMDLAHGLPYAMHLLPTYAWSRDSRSIVITQGGKIRRLTRRERPRRDDSVPGARASDDLGIHGLRASASNGPGDDEVRALAGDGAGWFGHAVRGVRTALVVEKRRRGAAPGHRPLRAGAVAILVARREMDRVCNLGRNRPRSSLAAGRREHAAAAPHQGTGRVSESNLDA